MHAYAPSLKYRAALSVTYGCGLRIFKIANLKITDIDSPRMLIRVEQGKGRKDRYVMLSPYLLDLLRRWWLVKRPRGWLFPGQQPAQPITTRQLDRACHAVAVAAKLDKRRSRLDRGLASTEITRSEWPLTIHAVHKGDGESLGRFLLSFPR